MRFYGAFPCPCSITDHIRDVTTPISIGLGGQLDGVLAEIAHETSVMVNDVSHAPRRSFLKWRGGVRLPCWVGRHGRVS